jgi:Cysteine-rich CWC
MTDTTSDWDPALATRQTRCERCGTVFGCRNLGEEGSCWCSMAEFRLPVPLPEGVGPFSDCLCPRCLSDVAAELRAQGHGPTR